MRFYFHPDADAELEAGVEFYELIYQVRAKTVSIIAVANLHQRPNYWKERIKQKNFLENGDK